MKSLFIDACLIMLILVGSAGAEAPAYLADPLQLIAEDAAAAKPMPRYTPIPASRKVPPAKPIEREAASVANEPSVESTPIVIADPSEIDFDALPDEPISTSVLGRTQTSFPPRSEFVPSAAATNVPTSGQLVAAPGGLAPPSIEFNGGSNVAPSFDPTYVGPTSVPTSASPIVPTMEHISPRMTPAAIPSSGVMPGPGTVVNVAPEPGYAYRPLVPVVSTPASIHLGRGILGQPTVYVPGQPVRNFFRYFSP